MFSFDSAPWYDVYVETSNMNAGEAAKMKEDLFQTVVEQDIEEAPAAKQNGLESAPSQQAVEQPIQEQRADLCKWLDKYSESSMCPGMIFAMPLCTSEAVEKVKAKDYVWKVIKAATGKLF